MLILLLSFATLIAAGVFHSRIAFESVKEVVVRSRCHRGLDPVVPDTGYAQVKGDREFFVWARPARQGDVS